MLIHQTLSFILSFTSKSRRLSLFRFVIIFNVDNYQFWYQETIVKEKVKTCLHHIFVLMCLLWKKINFKNPLMLYSVLMKELKVFFYLKGRIIRIYVLPISRKRQLAQLQINWSFTFCRFRVIGTFLVPISCNRQPCCPFREYFQTFF